jgi:hypothetical protein
MLARSLKQHGSDMYDELEWLLYSMDVFVVCLDIRDKLLTPESSADIIPLLAPLSAREENHTAVAPRMAPWAVLSSSRPLVLP